MMMVMMTTAKPQKEWKEAIKRYPFQESQVANYFTNLNQGHCSININDNLKTRQHKFRINNFYI